MSYVMIHFIPKDTLHKLKKKNITVKNKYNT